MLALLGTCTLIAVAMSRIGFGAAPQPAARRGHLASFVLLFAYTLVVSTNLQRRVDSTSLFTQGLSAQNRVQAVIVAGLACWALFLVTSRRVRPVELVAGKRLWVATLIVWFGVSTAWATTPTLALYRVVELGSVWVLAVSTFNVPHVRRRLIALMWLAIAAGASSAVLSQNTFEIVRSNTLAPIAAMLGLFGIDTMMRRGATPARLVGTAVPFWLFWAFDSLATAGALLVAAGAFLVGRAKPGPARIAALATAIVGGLVAVAGARTGPINIVDGFGAAYGKSQRYVSNWTGRLPLWEFMLDDVRGHPLGLGLGADRSLVLRDTAGEIGWAPLHAHNGFMAALYAGGFIGAVLAITILVAAARLVRRVDASAQPLGFAALALLAVNNLTVNGFGGTMSPGWMVMMAVIISGGQVFAGGPERGQSAVVGDAHVERAARRGRRADHEFVSGP